VRLALHWRSLGGALALDDLLDTAAAAGFVGVQANRDQLTEYVRRRPNSRLARRIAAAGLCQTATWLGLHLEAPEPEFLAGCERLPRLRYLLRALASFGVGQPAALVRAPAGAAGSDGAAGARLRLLAGLLAASGLTLLLDPADPSPEAPPPPRPVPPAAQEDDLRRLLGWVEAAGAPNVGLVLDLWRWPQLGASAALDALRGVPLLGRMADAPQVLPAPPAAVPRLVPGTGALDLTGAVRRMRALGYDGYWEVEAPLRGADAPALARRCRQAGERVLQDAVRF